MRDLILATGMGFSLPEDEQIRRIGAAGFDGVFTGWDETRGNEHLFDVVKAEGMIYQSIHAPFGKANLMWEEGEAGDNEEARQMRCLRETADLDIPILVMHTIIGFDRFSPSAIGVDRFGRILDEAKKLGVKVALENTEGECYLDRLMNDLETHPALGFCIDTGHEMCYNYSHDLISKYGDKLICTHLNDNNKITGEKITWLDDSHLMPFDGKADWDDIAARLKKANYKGELTFELTSQSKPERNTHDIYSSLDFDAFVALAYEKAVKFDKMMR